MPRPSPNRIVKADFAPTPRVKAKLLYWQGWRITQIGEELGLPANTIASWRRREKWDESPSLKRVEGAIEARLIQLVGKTQKSSLDFKEIDLLGRQQERFARIHRYNDGGNEADLNPNVRNRNAGKKKAPPARNALSVDQVAALEAAFLDGLFAYQRGWLEAYEQHRIIDILKSRQIGATFFWARQAIVSAAKTGRNKIFLSASRAQAYIFRAYIVAFVQEVCDVQLTGDPIILANGAQLHFLGTNAKTAQGYHGDVFVDEYFWIQRFQEFRKVVSGMSMHKKWKQVYCSTPSAITHDAYPFWSGEAFNKRRKKGERIAVDISHDALAPGKLCADGQWRQIVTIEDAERGGCDLFDIEQLRQEYSEDEFNNLLMCVFMDDTLSSFPFALLQRGMVDSWESWDDFKPFAARPVGNSEVWVGYDPSGDNEDSDGAGVVVDLPPERPGGVHRLIHHERFAGQDYEKQAAAILDLRQKYRIGHIGIDTTGIGDAVFKIVFKSFPQATAYRYDNQLKAAMVMQAQNMLTKGRLEFDAGWVDLVQSFLAIRPALTASGRAITYMAGRSGQTGHAELAWAAMHALHHEPIEAPSTGGSGGSFAEIYG